MLLLLGLAYNLICFKILLHDTQTTIEKLSERVDKLASGAEDSQPLVRNEELSEELERLVRQVPQELGMTLFPRTASGVIPSPDLGPWTKIFRSCVYIGHIPSRFGVISGSDGNDPPIMHSKPTQAPAPVELRHSISHS